jgi:hypothetical protein
MIATALTGAADRRRHFTGSTLTMKEWDRRPPENPRSGQ